MSLSGAETQLNNTGCWRAAAHGAVRSYGQWLSRRRVRATRAAAIIPRCNHWIWSITGKDPCV